QRVGVAQQKPAGDSGARCAAKCQPGDGATRGGIDLRIRQPLRQSVEADRTEVGGESGVAIQSEPGPTAKKTGDIDPTVGQRAEADVGVFTEVDFEFGGKGQIARMTLEPEPGGAGGDGVPSMRKD